MSYLPGAGLCNFAIALDSYRHGLKEPQPISGNRSTTSLFADVDRLRFRRQFEGDPALQSHRRFASASKSNYGWVAERFKAPVLKTDPLHPFPSLPGTRRPCFFEALVISEYATVLLNSVLCFYVEWQFRWQFGRKRNIGK